MPVYPGAPTGRPISTGHLLLVRHRARQGVRVGLVADGPWQTGPVADDDNAGRRTRRRGSRVLHGLNRWVSTSALAIVVVAADVVWVLYSTLVGFPTRVEAIFQTLVAALTLAMVFVIQHTQAREQIVTQRKLDEILRSLPYADNALIAFEEASDDELLSIHRSHRELRALAVEGPDRPGGRAGDR